MPLIHGYTSPLAAEGLHPSDLGIRATEEAARSMGEAGRAIGQDIAQVGDTVDNANFARDTSALSSEYAQTRTQLTQATNDFFKNADPNDPDLAAKYHEKVLQPALDGFGQGAISKRGTALAQKWRSDMSLDFGQTAVADQGIVAHGAVIANLENARHALTDSAYADPTTHDANQRAWGEVVEAQIASHQLNPEQAATLRATEGEAGHKAIAVAAGRSMAERNPAQATADFDSGKLGTYLDGEEVSVLKKYAEGQATAKDADIRRQEEDQRREASEASETRANQYLGAFVDPQTNTIRVPPNAGAAIMADPALKPSTKMELFGATERLARPAEFHPDSNVLHSLLMRVNLPETDPNHLTQDEALAHVGKDISKEDYNFIAARMVGKKPADFAEHTLMTQALRFARTAIVPHDPSGLIPDDPEQERHYSSFLGWFLPAYGAGMKSGKSPIDMLGNPKSKDYLLGHLNNFAPDAQSGFDAQMKANAQGAKALGGSTTQRKSLDDIFGGK